MPYWQLFYHLVWSTKNREPLITPIVEKHISRTTLHASRSSLPLTGRRDILGSTSRQEGKMAVWHEQDQFRNPDR